MDVRNVNRNNQMSESIELGIILALSGGFMDAYSYMCRGHVFANAQTGNMLLLGVNLSQGKWIVALHYFFPIASFAIGIVIATLMRHHLKEKKIKLHWRQFSVLIEAVVMIFVCFIPQSLNFMANSLISFACGIQVESFRKIHGNGVATTMCIGNLRSAAQNITDYWHTKDRISLLKGLLYLFIIFFFIIGAVMGNFFVSLIGMYALLICSGLLSAAFLLMFVDGDNKSYSSK